MPDFSSNIAFTVRFDLSIPDAPVLVLTDTGTGVPNGAVGHFDIVQPGGTTRFGSSSTPDIVTGTNTSYRFPLSHAYALAWQLGLYTIYYTLSDSGYTDTTISKTFTFNFAGLSLALTEQFDVFTPILKYLDTTDYTVPKFNAPTISRQWAANSAATGNVVSSNSFIDLSIGGNYYSSIYGLSLTSTIIYQSSVYGYLSFAFVVSESVEAETAFTPPSLNLMLSWVTEFRKALDKMWDVDVETLYAYASGLFSELKFIICNGGNDLDLTRKLYGATHRGASLSAKPTNLPIGTYDYSACGITNIASTPLSISVQPQPSTLSVGGTLSVSVTAAGGTGVKTFQWFKNETAKLGATASTYVVPNAQLADSATYSVVVSDSAGNSITSANAIIVVNAQPTLATIYYGIGAVPVNDTQITAGSSIQITAGAQFTIAWPSNSAPQDYWVAQPSTEPAKVKDNDGMFDEPIGPNQTFQASTVGTHTLFSTENPTSQLVTTTFKLS